MEKMHGEIDKAAQLGNKRCLPTESLTFQCKLSKQTDKIINTRADQEAVNRELKAQNQELQSVRDRQHQNLFVLHMQYETLDGECRYEKKSHGEVILKTETIREIITQLENGNKRYVERMTHCEGDKRQLYEAYKETAGFLKEAKGRIMETEEKQKLEVIELKEQLQTEKTHKEAILNKKKEMEMFYKDRYNKIEEQNAAMKEAKAAVRRKLKAFNDENVLIKCNNDEKDKTIAQLRDKKEKLAGALSEIAEKIIDRRGAFENVQSAINKIEEVNSTSSEQNKMLDMQVTEKLNMCEISKTESDKTNEEFQVIMAENQNLIELAEMKEKALPITQKKKSEVDERLTVVTGEIEHDDLTSNLQVEAFNQENAAILDSIAQHKIRLEEEKSENIKLNSGLKESEDKISALIDNYVKTCDEHKKKICDLQKQVEQKKHEITEISPTTNNLKTELEKYIQANAEIEIRIAQHDKTIAECELNDATLNEKVKTMETSYKLRDEDFQSKREEYRKAYKEGMSLTKRYNELEVELKKIILEREQIEKKVEGQKRQEEEGKLQSERSDIQKTTPQAKKVNRVTFATPERTVYRYPRPSPIQSDSDVEFISDDSSDTVGRSPTPKVKDLNTKKKLIQDNKVSNASDSKESKKKNKGLDFIKEDQKREATPDTFSERLKSTPKFFQRNKTTGHMKKDNHG